MDQLVAKRVAIGATGKVALLLTPRSYRVHHPADQLLYAVLPFRAAELAAKVFRGDNVGSCLGPKTRHLHVALFKNYTPALARNNGRPTLPFDLCHRVAPFTGEKPFDFKPSSVLPHPVGYGHLFGALSHRCASSFRKTPIKVSPRPPLNADALGIPSRSHVFIFVLGHECKYVHTHTLTLLLEPVFSTDRSKVNIPSTIYCIHSLWITQLVGSRRGFALVSLLSNPI